MLIREFDSIIHNKQTLSQIVMDFLKFLRLPNIKIMHQGLSYTTHFKHITALPYRIRDKKKVWYSNFTVN